MGKQISDRLGLNSIQGKVLGSSIVQVLTVVVFSFLAYLQVNKLEEGELKSNFQNLRNSILNIKTSSNEFILKDWGNEEFYKSGESVYISHYEDALEDFSETIDKMLNNLQTAGFHENTELEGLREKLGAYDSLFQQIRLKTKDRGFGQFGIIGEFEKLLTKLGQFDFGNDNTALIRLRNFVLEYQLYGQEKTVSSVSSEIYRFSTVLDQYISDQEVDHVIDLLSSYESVFGQLAVIDQELGVYNAAGLRKELFDKMELIENNQAFTITNAKVSKAYDSILQRALLYLMLLIITTILVSLFILVKLNGGVVRPVNELKKLIKEMGDGTIPEHIPYYSTVELQDMAQSVEKLSDGLKNTSEFAKNVGEGNFDYDFQPLGEEDQLGHSLVDMRDSLKVAGTEDEMRNWKNSGIAKFSEILRSQNEGTGALYDTLISNIVTYTGANQGALFVLDDEDTHMILGSAYAWDKKKYVEGQVKKGQGLVGQAWIEGEYLLLKEVPEDYIKITSGLGKSNPNCILAMPLKFNEEVLGVIEIASFKMIEGHILDFISDISETIASAISINKINERTRNLLEQSQQNTEQVQAQEEEMRQNMEELSATQEEMSRKEQEYLSQIDELKKELESVTKKG